MLFQLPMTALILGMNTANTFASPEVLCGGHYQLLVVVIQRHGGTTPVLNEHQHSRREERGWDELVAQCLQSNVPSHAI